MKAQPEFPQSGYEASDARVGWVLASVGLLVIGIMLSMVAAERLYHRDRQSTLPAKAERLFQSGATAESGIARDWKAQDAAVRQHLQNYAWVDRAAGLVQIPIDRAIELTAQKPAATPESQP